MAKWWHATKETWRKERQAGKKRKQRRQSAARRAERLAALVLAERPHPAQWSGDDVAKLIAAGKLTQEQAIVLIDAARAGAL